MENYENVDGRAAYHSDAKGLSLGLAQWNDRGRVDISAKVWRYAKGKMVAPVRGTPLHRVLDLAILICRAAILRMPTAFPSCMMKPRRRLIGLVCRAMR